MISVLFITLFYLGLADKQSIDVHTRKVVPLYLMPIILFDVRSAHTFFDNENLKW